MTRRAPAALAAALCWAAAAAGCGIGPGDVAGEVELRITREQGAVEMVAPALHEISESDTVMRLTDRNAEIETRYSGGFVQAIDGLEGGLLVDWFYWVNGVEAGRGGDEYALHDGDRVWWDHRDWTAAMRVPAVVGQYPEPLLHGYEGTRHPVSVVCMGPVDCEPLRRRLELAGVVLGPPSQDAIRVLAGPWGSVRRDPVARLLEQAPQASGVFARLSRGERGWELALLDERGAPAREGGPGAPLIAALRPGERPPTWLVTGTDVRGARAAMGLLDEENLDGKFAIGPGALALPVR